MIHSFSNKQNTIDIQKSEKNTSRTDSIKGHVVYTCMTAPFHWRCEAWAHNTSSTPPLDIEVPVPTKENEQSCIYVLGVSNLFLSTSCSDVFWNWSDIVLFFPILIIWNLQGLFV
jgi:hypothetical protein